ncbi:MAG: hypothetical protein RLZZ269_190 [Actinomycetota bacterium]
MTRFDRPAAGTTSVGSPRLIGLDVTRAIALIGVVVMNYVGAMYEITFDPSLLELVLDPYTGVLSTRFAATFVVVAGISITLLTERARHGDEADRRAARLRLARRGLLLLLVGYFLDFHWPGTILFFYGAYFLLATVLFALSERWLVVIGVASAVVATSVRTVLNWRYENGHYDDWINSTPIDSLQDLLVRTFLDYTHPVFPWLAYLCAGIIIGRHLSNLAEWRGRVAALCFGVAVGVYVASTILDAGRARENSVVWSLTSMQTFERSLPFTAATLAIAILATVTIVSLAERFASSPIVAPFQRAGQLTLSLYLLHVLVYYVFVEWTGWVSLSSVAAALLFALGFWVVAIALGSWWHHRIGRGPAEVVYRAFGG